jgi:VanZ family protein
MAFIFVLSSRGDVDLPPGLSDKAAHVLAYAGLGLLALRALAGGLGMKVGWRAAVGALLITVIYGVSDELHQRAVAGRTAELLDLYADALGGLVGVGAFRAWSIIAPRPDA